MKRPRVTLVGYPFRATGTGAQLRATFRALRAIGVDAAARDLDPRSRADAHGSSGAIRARLVRRIDSDITIFVLNGAEREKAFQRLGGEMARAGHQVAYPSWALPRYPEACARELDRCDEVWATSRFARSAFASTVRTPLFTLPPPCQPVVTRQLSRRHFGLSETAYVFLSFFDLASYFQDPFAVVSAFAKVREARPFADVQLVLKLNDRARGSPEFDRFLAAVEPHKRRTLIIERTLSDDEVGGLIHASDGVVSLHRSEGFGLHLGEAMYFAKPVVATGYSGNMDFMTAEIACLVGHSLVPVSVDRYPFADGQAWAEPDVEEAARHMIRLLDDPDAGRSIGARASAHVRTHFSQRACGLRYLSRLEAIAAAGAAA